ncbi:hypothetical protein CSKR_109191 [Clonorchis sinensis]|uniref:Uncharacterized protein n=1 Tax=Clonorchis sinensis TaxID=79923 RepID=A0A419Q383_CLOSI|nr:hypothetical protein CSKR_109191 [Clonorchis sinensis]
MHLGNPGTLELWIAYTYGVVLAPDEVVSGVRSHGSTEIIFEHCGFLGLFHFLGFPCSPYFTVGSHTHFQLTSDNSSHRFMSATVRSDIQCLSALSAALTQAKFPALCKEVAISSQSMPSESSVRASAACPGFFRVRTLKAARYTGCRGLKIDLEIPKDVGVITNESTRTSYINRSTEGGAIDFDSCDGTCQMAQWLEREFTDRKIRGSNPASASRFPLFRLGQPGSIPALVPPGGMTARH